MLKRLVLPLSLLLCVACSDDTGNTPPPADAAAAAADADPNAPDAMPGAVLGFLEQCDVSNDQCDTSMDLICFAFNNKGPHCTHTCQGPEDCAAPSTGCSGMGVCKVP
jgi:hypothetical protein